MRVHTGIQTLLVMLLLSALIFFPASGFAEASDGDSGTGPPELGEQQALTEWQVRGGYENDEVFVTSEGYDLDEYLFYGDGPLEFDIEIDRVYNVIGADWDEIIKDARLVLKVWDVDEDGACNGDPLQPERDYVYINGHLCEASGSGHYLTGANNTWSVWTFDIPVEWFEDGWIKTGTYRTTQPPLPGVNHIRIDIDTVTHSCWAVECDWGMFEIVGTRPSLLVHGMRSDWTTWTDMAPYIDGWLFDFAQLGGKSTIAENAGKLGDYFDQMLTRFGVDHGNIIAHSKGGLDSRQFISGDQRVDNLITIGTPNRGTEYADHGTSVHEELAWILCGSAVWDLRTSFVEVFNGLYVKNPAVTYHSIGGDRYSAQETTCGVPLCSHQIFQVRNDRLVPVDRVLLPWQSSVNDMESREHSELIHEGGGYLYNTYIRGWLNAPSRFHRVRAPGSRLAMNEPVRSANAEGNRSAEQLTRFIDVPLTGAQADSTLLIDLCDEARFYAVGDNELSFSIRTPGGTLINPSYASSHGDVDYSAEDTGLFGHWYTYTVDDPQSGSWHILLSAADTTRASAGASLDSDLVVEASVDFVSQEVGEPVTVSATVMDGGSPVSTAVAVAVFSRADGHEESFLMSYVGDGAYDASCTTEEPGEYGVVVKVTGTSRTAFSRQAVERVTVYPTGASVSSVGNGYGQDTNANGLYDSVCFPLDIAVTRPESLRVWGLLKTASGLLAGCASAEAYCGAEGHYQVVLCFDGETICGLGEDGPYELYGLLVSELNGSGMVIEASELTGTTPAYDCDDFERSAIVFTDQNSEATEDSDYDGLYDSLILQIGVDLVEARTYQWNGRLDDRYGNQIAWATGSGSLQADASSVTLEFDGLDICAGGVDGPYYLRDLYVFSTAGYQYDGVAPDAYETLPYAFAEFEHGQTDLALLQHSLGGSSQEPYVGEMLTLRATVVNVGDDCTDELLVRFSAADAGRSQTVGEVRIHSLAFGESYTAEVPSFAPRIPGEWNVQVEVDPDDAVTEADEYNNTGEIRLTVVDRTQTEEVMVDGVVKPGDTQCRILLDLDRGGTARILIYDLRGRKIKTVVDDSLPEGKSTLSWDLTDDEGESVTSGTYVCFIEAGGQTVTRKVAVLR